MVDCVGYSNLWYVPMTDPAERAAWNLCWYFAGLTGNHVCLAYTTYDHVKLAVREEYEGYEYIHHCSFGSFVIRGILGADRERNPFCLSDPPRPGCKEPFTHRHAEIT